jgi:hypothetical protein
VVSDFEVVGIDLHAFTRAEIDLFRQWFDNVQDVNPAYLTDSDYALAARLYLALDMRVPNSIAERVVAWRP